MTTDPMPTFNRHVLVIDDDGDIRDAISQILEYEGYSVTTAANGKEAVAKARAELPAAIFLDIVMPDMDGYEACRMLNEDPATKDIPVIFVSSKGQKADQVWGQMQGARGYVVKPYRPEQLIDQLKALA